MLKIPAYRYFSDQRVTAYQDDVMWWKFYLIPDYVSIRRDVKGDPVFLLIKYAFSDEDRANNAALPTGGGFMVFDVELSAMEEDTKKVTEVLQADVNAVWNQMKAAADAKGGGPESYSLNAWYYLQNTGARDISANTTVGVGDLLLGLGPDSPQAPPGDRPPTVVLDMPTWTEGTFSVSAPQSEALVSHRVASGKVSLVGRNVASANMDLTAAGATFMQKTLLNTDGGGAGDLTPIQVVYELKFLARVPPVHILVQADSRSLYQGVKSIMHTYEDNDCDEDVMNHGEQNITMAVQSGLVKIQIDPGLLPLADDFLQQLISSAQTFVTTQIKDNFFQKKPAPPAAADDPTKDFVNADHDIYYFKQDLDFSSVHIGYDETIAAVQQWPANPQGTLQTFFAGLSADKMKQFVRVVDLEDPFFQTLNLTATAFVPWEEKIDFLEVQFRYHGQDENGQTQDKVEAFTFTKEHTTDTWDPRLLDGKREYEYQWRVGYTGHGPGAWSGWKRDSAPKLNLDVGNPGHLQIDIAAGNINFGDVTSSVQVDVSYADAAAGLAEESTTVILGQNSLLQKYDRWLFVPQAKPLRYRTRFFLKTGQQVESDWQETTSRPLVINEPSSIQKLEVNIFPVGDGWAGVQQAIVDLRHGQDGSTLQLKSLEEFRKWVVVLDDPAKADFEYKYVASFKDGTPPYTVDWTPARGDQSLPLSVPSPPRLTVQMWPQLVDFGVTPLVQATLHYDDPTSNIHETESFVFKDAGTPQSWGPFPIHDDNKRNFRYQLTYHQAHGDPLPQPEVTTDSDEVIFEALDVPKVHCLVSPTVLDFSKSPVVEVNVDYHDSGIDYTDTLTFSDATAKPFSFQIADAGSKTYQISLTYYLADGTVVSRDPVTMSRTAITIPRYLA